jgi:hypothetical protein
MWNLFELCIFFSFLVYINNIFYLGIRCEKKNKAKPFTVSRKCTLATLKRYTNKVNVVPNYKYNEYIYFSLQKKNLILTAENVLLNIQMIEVNNLYVMCISFHQLLKILSLLLAYIFKKEKNG